MLNKRDIIKSFVSKHKGNIAGAFMFGLLSVLSGILIPLFIGKFYQLAFQTHSARGKLFDNLFGEVEGINQFFLLLFSLLVCRMVFNYFEKYFSGLNGELFSKFLREQLFAKQMITQLADFEKKETGSYLLRYSGDLVSAQNYLTKGIIGFIVDCLFTLAAIAFFLSVNVQLTIIVLVIFPVIFLSNHLLNRKLKQITRNKRNIRSSNLAFVTSRLKAIGTIKVYNREAVERNKFESRSGKLFRYGKKYVRLYAFINALYLFLLYGMLGAILYTSYWLIQQDKNSIDGGILITYIMLTISTIPVYKRILKVSTIRQAGDVSLKKLLVILNAPEEKRTKEDEIKIKKGEIVIRDLSFGFTGTKLLFNQLNMNIPANELTVIKGLQGVGKSTLFKLLTGLYEYDSGSIRIDGHEVREFSRHTLRKHIALISDELPLIGKTIFESISYSRRKENREAAQEMLDRLGFQLNGLKNVLDYPVKDGGSNLSAGERKLLMIARALLTHKKIMLMDQPLKDLEMGFKTRVASILNEFKSKHTIVITDNEFESFLSPGHKTEIKTYSVKNLPV